MKILALADTESPYLWDHFDKAKFKDIDLILSAGDLKPAYLSFLTTLTNIPVYYVHGNHDTLYKTTPPGGCTCIDGDLHVINGVRILGLGGSMKYNSSDHQYSEREMRLRYKKLFLKIRRHGGIDILLTHAPARGYGDKDDLPHQGFETFNAIIDRFHPRYMIHGHVHQSYSYNFKRICKRQDTEIINAYERYLIDFET